MALTSIGTKLQNHSDIPGHFLMFLVIVCVCVSVNERGTERERSYQNYPSMSISLKTYNQKWL